jgi:O-glycosyl hydrolase
MGTARLLCVAVACVCLCWGRAVAVDVAVDVSDRHQIVDGFGFTRDNISPWRVQVGPFYQTVDLADVGFYDSLAGDFRVGRLVLNPLQDSLGAPYDSIDLTHVHEFAQRGVTRYFAAVPSPPAWMKDNQSLTNGGHLLPEYYDEFALMVAEYARQFRERTGIDLYGLCLQVEPGFEEPYASCVYTQFTYHDMMRVAGPIIDSIVPNVKLLAPQDVLSSFYWRSNQWMRAMMDDSTTGPYIDIYAVNCHRLYFDTPTSEARQWWDAVREVAEEYGLDLWLTSSGDGYDTTWATAVRVGAAIANSFKYGNITEWTWFSISSDAENANNIVYRGSYTGKYYQVAHYGRFLKAGARRVGSSCADDSLANVAFVNLDGSAIVVLVNGRTSGVTAALSGAGLPDSLQAFQSTGDGVRMADLGWVAPGDSLVLPPLSTTTLVSDSTTGVRGAAAGERDGGVPVRARCLPGGNGLRVETAVPMRVSAELYTLGGRCVARAVGDGPVSRYTVLRWQESGLRATGVYLARVSAAALEGGPVAVRTVRVSLRP